MCETDEANGVEDDLAPTDDRAGLSLADIEAEVMRLLEDLERGHEGGVP
jgi:hypothetical protein